MPRTRGSRNKKGTLSKPKMEIRRRNFKVRLGNYNFTRYASDTITTGGTVFQLPAILTEKDFSFVFALNKIRNSTDFTNLFDQYQITKVDLYIKMITNPDGNTVQQASGTYWPVLWYVPDYDDSGPMTVASMQEKQGVKRFILKPDSIIKISVNPKFLAMSYQTLTTTGYSPRTGFLDCVDTAIPHYAMKTVIQAINAGTDWFVEVQAKYHLSFKGPQ